MNDLKEAPSTDLEDAPEGVLQGATESRQWYPSTARNAALAYERDQARQTRPR